MDNFDDIAEKYRNEIINLYKNQESAEPIAQDILDNAEEIISDSDDAKNDIPVKEYPVMPPAVSETALYDKKIESGGLGKGFLKVSVTTGGAYPVENALVMITQFQNGSERILNILQTDESGETPVIELDAPLKNGTNVSDRNPYMYYNIIVSSDGYYEVQNKNAALFAGVTSIQPVNLIPLPAYTDEKQVMTFYEQEPDL